MSNRRQCCRCGCAPGQIVRPQPCDFSSAFGHHDTENNVNVSHWDISCIPYFDCQYIKTQIEQSDTGVISFAFQGACWFFDGSETNVNQCDIYPCSTTHQYGFDFTGGDAFGRIEQIEAVYESCDDCKNDASSVNGELLNERWYKFVLCDCEEDFSSDIPDPDGGPGIGDKPDDTPGQGDDGCENEDDYCVRAFEDKPIYIPARFMKVLLLTNCCVDGTGPGTLIDCITPAGCDDPLEKCHYWQEPISHIMDNPGQLNCCLKSCTADNKPDIVTTIPCGITTNPDEPTDCECLGLWTPFLLHSLEGGVQDGHCNWSPIVWNRENAIVLTPDTVQPGARQRGCCQCCCGPPCRLLAGDWDYCRAFEGMSTFDIIVEWSDEANVGGPLPGDDWESFDAWNTHQYPCPGGTRLITYTFTVHPDVPDCIEAGGTEAECVPYDEGLNVTDCILLISANGGVQADCCEHWDSPTDFDFPGDNTSGGIYLDTDCTDCTDNDEYHYWKHIIFRTEGGSACGEATSYWFPPGGECGECISNDGDCDGSPADMYHCGWCCADNYIDTDGSGPCDDQLYGTPCCADTMGFCDGRAVYVSKKCSRSPGGTGGYWDSSHGLRWGHHSFCKEPETGMPIGMRIAFSHQSGVTGYPGIHNGGGPAWQNNNSYHSCCTGGNLGYHDGETHYGCHDGCGNTACEGGRWTCGITDGSFNCPYLFCFLLPDDRIDGETGDCRPAGWVSSQASAGEITIPPIETSLMNKPDLSADKSRRRPKDNYNEF